MKSGVPDDLETKITLVDLQRFCMMTLLFAGCDGAARNGIQGKYHNSSSYCISIQITVPQQPKSRDEYHKTAYVIFLMSLLTNWKSETSANAGIIPSALSRYPNG
jgi:hypothetical protein